MLRSMKNVTLSMVLILVTVLLCSAGTYAGEKRSTVIFWTFLNPADSSPRNMVQSMLIEQFEEQNPNIAIEVQVLPWTEINPQLIQAVSVGKGPDVVRIAIDSFDLHFAAGSLYPLTEFTDRWDEEEKNDWLLPWTEGLFQGDKMALPIEHRVGMMMYREDFLSEIGVESFPNTWDELGKICGELSKKGYVGLGLGLSYGGTGNSLMEWLWPVVWSAGGTLIDEEGNATLATEPVVKAMSLLHDLVHKYEAIPREALTWDVNGVFQGIQAGRVACSLWLTHGLMTARQSVGDDLKVAPVPSIDGDGFAPAYVGGWQMAMAATVTDKEAAWKFIEFMTSADAQLENAKVAGEMPSRRSVYEDPWFQSSELGREMTNWKEYLELGGRIAKWPEDYVFLHRVLVEAAQRIVLANEPIEEVLQEAEERYNGARH